MTDRYEITIRFEIDSGSDSMYIVKGEAVGILKRYLKRCDLGIVKVKRLYHDMESMQ